ncbi:MAG: glycosyltransferase family 61 protein [Phycisphaerae bacterium]
MLNAKCQILNFPKARHFRKYCPLVIEHAESPLERSLKELFRNAYRFPVVRALLHRFGPAVWRLPRELRRRMVPESGWVRARGAEVLAFGTRQNVHPAKFLFAEGGMNLGQRMAAARYRLPQGHVARLPQAWLVGKHAAPMTSDGKLLLSPFRDAPRILALEWHEDILAFVRGGEFRIRPTEPQWREVFPLVSRLDPNYFHWMVESCGQLQGLEAYCAATDTKPQILIRAGGNAYIRQSLELLGYGGQIIEWTEGNAPAFAEGVILATLPGNRVACSPASLRWLRGKFLAAAGVDAAGVGETGATRKIYIRRKPGGWRSVANDDEVAEALEAEGFETTRPEGLTLAQQIRLFAEAKIIVGMHGAGLTNILFAPGAAILELTGDYGGGEYMSMASGLGNAYGSMRCRTEGDDIVVDVGALRAVIGRLQRSTNNEQRTTTAADAAKNLEPRT